MHDENANLELEDKEFRKIPSLQFLYEINASGRTVRNVKSKRSICQRRTHRGYWLITGSIKGKRFNRTVHSLVAECWLGEKPSGYEIDHIDKNKDNNGFRNLRYVTHSENNLNRNMPWKRPVMIKKDNVSIRFDTSKKCAEFIASSTGRTYGGIRARLVQGRKHILGYDIFYLPMQRLDAATA